MQENDVMTSRMVAAMQEQHIAAEMEKFGNTGKVVQMFLKHGDVKSAQTLMKTALKLTDEADLEQIMATYRQNAAIRMAGVKMPERMAAEPKEARFTEIKEAGKDKVSGLWAAMKGMETKVRNFILQRGNPRVTPAY